MRGDVRERLRTARGVRATGIVMLVGGAGLLTRASTWARYNQAIAVHIHGGPSFTLSFAAVSGGVAIVVGPIVAAAGQWLLRRATIAAIQNPLTASIVDEVDS